MSLVIYLPVIQLLLLSNNWQRLEILKILFKIFGVIFKIIVRKSIRSLQKYI